MSYNKLLLKHVRQLISFQFGVDGDCFFPEDCVVEVSPSTGKIRRVWLDGRVLVTVRPSDGMISLTLDGGLRLLRLTSGLKHRVIVDEEGERLIKNGFDLSAANIVAADESIIPGQEVLVVNRSGDLLAVGKAVISGYEMKELKCGTSVKIRHKV